MWNNGDDFHEETGDRVRLYQPIAYSSGRQFSCHDPTASFVGGSPAGATPTATCAHCQDSLHDSLLVQLHVPNRQLTYQVVGCNKAACVNQLFTSQQQQQQGRQWFSVGGGGVFYCWKKSTVQDDDGVVESSTTPATMVKPTVTAPPANNAAPEVNDWIVDSDDDDDNNNDNNNDLEEQIAALELKPKSNTSKKSSNKPQTKQSQSTTTTTATKGGLPCFELHSLLEPPGKTPTKRTMEDDDDDDDDDDMIGGTTNSSSDAKIQQMLAKYMAEEDDEEILAALKGTTSGSGGGKSREKDERLKASDRALWAFTDRIKRSPRQVLRYAPDGIPLWSIPRPPAQQEGVKNSKVSFQQQQQQQRKKNKKGNKKGDSSSTTATSPIVIPTCPSCGMDRRFEFQLMPSLLHVLEVDKHAVAKSKEQQQTDSSTSNNTLEDIMKDDYGGMNWGVLAIYTCPSNTCTNQEEFVVVQASVDETPRKRAGALPSDAPVFIPENQTFDPLTEDGDLQMNDDEDDNDDEDTCEDENDLVFTLDG